MVSGNKGSKSLFSKLACYLKKHSAPNLCSVCLGVEIRPSALSGGSLWPFLHNLRSACSKPHHEQTHPGPRNTHGSAAHSVC